MFLSHVNSGRRRRVRLSYPSQVVDLVLALVPTCGVAAVAKVADIPESVVYRWRSLRRGAVRTAPIAQLLHRCVGLSPHYAKLCELTQASLVDPQHEVSDSISPSPAPLIEDRRAAPLGNVCDKAPASISADAIERLHLAKAVIEEHYSEPLNCSMLARGAAMSRSYFIRRFGELFGMTPHQYLLHTRVEVARNLLQHSAESIDVIAAGVGFRSGANLGRAFKRVAGHSISQAHAFTPTPE